jgi:hypothetical protein
MNSKWPIRRALAPLFLLLCGACLVLLDQWREDEPVKATGTPSHVNARLHSTVREGPKLTSPNSNDARSGDVKSPHQEAQVKAVHALYEKPRDIKRVLRAESAYADRRKAIAELDPYFQANAKSWVAKAKSGDALAAYAFAEHLSHMLVMVDPVTQQEVVSGEAAHKVWMPPGESIDRKFWLRLAAEAGDPLAALDLSSMLYAAPNPQSPNPALSAEAQKWLELSARKGLDFALYQLGVSHIRGEFQPSNPVVGHAYLAAYRVVTGEPQAKTLEYLYTSLRPGEIDAAIHEASRILAGFGRA